MKYQEGQIEVLNEIFRVTKPGGSIFYNHKVRWDAGYFLHPVQWITKTSWTIRQEIIWDRGIAANMRGWRFWQVDERIYWLHKPKGGSLIGDELESRHAKMSSIWRFKPAARADYHPALFPLELPVRAIYSVSSAPHQVVLDPFCGIGTTLVAAASLGHSYIGIDLSPSYVELARKRLENMEVECAKVKDEVGRHFIEDPFKDRKKRGTVTWPFGPKSEEK